MNSENIYNLVRSLAKPYSGAHVSINDFEYKVWKCKMSRQYRQYRAGKILEFLDNQPTFLVKALVMVQLLLDHEGDISLLAIIYRASQL